MANGEPMNSLSDAKAALRRICEEFDVEPEDWKPIDALIERLTAPLDADDGREFVRILRVNGSNDAADLIEHQAAQLAAKNEELAGLREKHEVVKAQALGYINRIAALTAIPEDAAQDDYEKRAWAWLSAQFSVPEDRDYSADQMVDAFIAGRADAYAAREADRARVDAEVRAKIEAVIRRSNGHPWEATWNEIRALLDTAKPAKPATDLAKLRREVEAMKLPGAAARNRTLAEVLALIDQQEAGE